MGFVRQRATVRPGQLHIYTQCQLEYPNGKNTIWFGLKGANLKMQTAEKTLKQKAGWVTRGRHTTLRLFRCL